MLQLINQTATLENFANYAERHGEDHVNGVALKFSTYVPMAFLNSLAPGLTQAVYTSGGLRFSDLGPLKWKRALVGASVTLDANDLLGARVLNFELATVDKIELDPKDGGSVQMTFRVKVKPTPDDVALIYQMQHQDLLITINPASASEETEDDDEPQLEGV